MRHVRRTGHRRWRTALAGAAIALGLCGTGPAALAQSLFAPVVRVNDSVITEWEVDQRARFLDLFRTPGDVRTIAVERLIDERLQSAAALEAGFTASPEEIAAGMAEFASRANLSAEQFIEAIGQGGVSPEAFRDFVSAGILWRQLVRDRFAAAVRPNEEAINDRLLEVGTEGGARVLLSEIILPAGDPATRRASAERAREIAAIGDADAFAAAARLYSRAPTRPEGGELDWRALADLPDEVRPAIAALRPGQTSRPVDLGSAIALFHMRDRDEVRAAAPGDIRIDHVILRTGSADAAARAEARIRVCNDAYAVARDLGPERLIRETVPLAEIPAGVRAVLADLDANEIGRAPGEAGTLVMLCGRVLNTEAALNRPAVFEELVSAELAASAALLLADLRAKAVITRPE